MKEEGRQTGQKRDGAGRSEAVLVSERRAVWTTLSTPAPSNDSQAVSDPTWDHAGGTRWTPDLVHCRLVNVALTMARLPNSTIGKISSVLGKYAEAEEGDVRPVPTAQEISQADWTWAELLTLDPLARGIAVGMAFGLTVRSLAKRLGKGKSTIADSYMQTRRQLAARWIRLKHPVDAQALERWSEAFQKERK